MNSLSARRLAHKFRTKKEKSSTCSLRRLARLPARRQEVGEQSVSLGGCCCCCYRVRLRFMPVFGLCASLPVRFANDKVKIITFFVRSLCRRWRCNDLDCFLRISARFNLDWEQHAHTTHTQANTLRLARPSSAAASVCQRGRRRRNAARR